MPTTYAGGGGAAGSQINANTQSALATTYFDTINSGLDVLSASREDVAKGEYNGAAQEYQFATGKQAFRRYDNARATWAWTTGLTKVNDDGANTESTDWAIDNKVEYSDIFGCGIRLYLEADAFVFIEALIEVHTPANNENGKIYNLLDASSSDRHFVVPSHVKLEVDGTIQNETIGYAFEESSENNILSTEPNPFGGGNNDAAYTKYRIYHLQFGETLLKGYHTLKVRVDTRNERTYAAARNFIVESFFLDNAIVGGYITAG